MLSSSYQKLTVTFRLPTVRLRSNPLDRTYTAVPELQLISNLLGQTAPCFRRGLRDDSRSRGCYLASMRHRYSVSQCASRSENKTAGNASISNEMLVYLEL